MDASTPANTAAPSPASSGSVLTLTPSAIAQVKTVMKGQGWEGYYLSVRVVPSGCSGLGYDLNLVKDTKPGDLVWEQEGIRIVTDGLSSKYLNGTVVDFQSSVHAAGFKFNNPNAQQSCGCGQTFSA